jgi:hypothetical protein
MSGYFNVFGDSLVLVLFTVIWAVSFALIIRFVWKTFAPFPRSQFGYYITDIWTLNLSLLPAFYLLRWAELQSPPMPSSDHGVFIYLLVLLAASELLGIFVARLHSIPAEGERIPQRLGQAGWILGGAVMGAFFMGASALLTFMVLLIFTVWPCFLALLMAVAVLRFAQWLVSQF